MARSGRGRGRDRRRRATATARPCAGHTASPRRTGGRVSTLCRITSEAEHHYKLSLDSPVSAPASCACGSWELGARWVCACTRRLCRVTVDLYRPEPAGRYTFLYDNAHMEIKIVPHVPCGYCGPVCGALLDVAVHGAVSTRVRVWIIGSRDQHGAVVPHAEHGRASFHLFSTRDV